MEKEMNAPAAQEKAVNPVENVINNHKFATAFLSNVVNEFNANKDNYSKDQYHTKLVQIEHAKGVVDTIDAELASYNIMFNKGKYYKTAEPVEINDAPAEQEAAPKQGPEEGK